MKLLFTFLSGLCFPFIVFSQGPLVKQWDAGYGGGSSDLVSAFQQTADGGYMLAGSTLSDMGGDISQTKRGDIDFWIVRLDSLGNLLWERRFGGNYSSKLNAAVQTRDGGFILGGGSYSDSINDVSEPRIGWTYDFWAVKIDSSGNKQWDKRYGGTEEEIMTAAQQTADGGYILGGKTNSPAGNDVTDTSRGQFDYWIVKTDSAGNKLWDSRFGGVFGDFLMSVEQTPDGGYILGGSTQSLGGLGPVYGDLTQPGRGIIDYWIVKTDSLGHKLWDKRFGSTYMQELNSVQNTPDGGFVLGGFGSPDSAGDYSQNTRGLKDFWMVKVDSAGNKQWDRRFGGNDDEDEYGYIRLTNDGGYLLSGTSYSDSSGDKTMNNLGPEQAWVVKVNANGTKQWDKTIFTASHVDDELGLAIQTRDSCYAIAVQTMSDMGGYKTGNSKGFEDFWMIKFCPTGCNITPPPVTAIDTIFCANGGTQVCAPSDYAFYTWNTGDSDSCIAVSQAGNYYVTVTDHFGCSVSSGHLAISVYSPPAVSISVNGDTLSAYNGVSYQWYLNGNVIPGATSGIYVATIAGSYSVAVTDSNGCSANSLPVVYAGVKDVDIVNAIAIYQTPGSSQLNVIVATELTGALFTIYDAAGRKMFSSKLQNIKTEIETQNFPTGAYVAEVWLHDIAKRVKWVKL